MSGRPLGRPPGPGLDDELRHLVAVEVLRFKLSRVEIADRFDVTYNQVRTVERHLRALK